MASQLSAHSKNTRVHHASRYEHLETWSPRQRGNGSGPYFALALVIVSLAGLAYLFTH